MALGVVLTLGNTLRLGIEARRDEIVVIKLIGGGNAFARRPFCIPGCLPVHSEGDGELAQRPCADGTQCTG